MAGWMPRTVAVRGYRLMFICIISAALLSNTHAQLNSTSQNSSVVNASFVTSPPDLSTETDLGQYTSATRTDSSYQTNLTQRGSKSVTAVEGVKTGDSSTSGDEIYSVTSVANLIDLSRTESRPTTETSTTPTLPSTELLTLTQKSTNISEVTTPGYIVETISEISLDNSSSNGDSNVTRESVVDTSELLQSVTTASSPTSVSYNPSSYRKLPISAGVVTTPGVPTTDASGVPTTDATGVPTTDASGVPKTDAIGVPTTEFGALDQSEISSLTGAWNTNAHELNRSSTPPSETTSSGQMSITQAPSAADMTSEEITTRSPTMTITDATGGDPDVMRDVTVTTQEERHVETNDVTTDDVTDVPAILDEVTAHVKNDTLTIHPVSATAPPTGQKTDHQPSVETADPSNWNVTISTTTATSNGTTLTATSGDLPPGSSNILPIAIGASVGALLIVLIIILVCVCRKKRKEIERKKRYLREEENVMDYVYHPRRPSNSIPPYKVNGSGLRLSNTGPRENMATDNVDVDPATKPAIRNYFQEGLRGLEQTSDRSPPENQENRPRYDSSNVMRREKKPSFPLRAISAKSRASMGPILLTEDSDGQPSTQKTYDKMYSSHSTFRK